MLIAFVAGNSFAQGGKSPQFISKNGIGLVMPDSLFSINFRFRIQSRVGIASHEDNLGNVTEADMRIRRMRLRFEGFMLNPRLTYNVQLSFTRADQDWDNSAVPLVLRDAMINYALTKHFTVGIGQGKLPGNRQRVVSSGDIHFTDRSIVNSAYTLDRDAGLFGTYRLNLGKSPYVLLKGAITSGEGRGIANTKEFSNTVTPNGGVAYTGRVEFLPLGEFTNKGDYFEGDLEREPKPKLSIGATYHYNDRAIRTQGQLGKALYAARSFVGTNLDVMLKYRGWAITSEYISRKMADGQSVFTKKSATDSVYVIAGYGINTEVSYTFKNMWEIAGRYAFIQPVKSLSTVGKDGQKYEEYCLGLIKYLRKHRVKLVNELSYYKRTAITGTNPVGLVGYKFQVELGI
ncbi:MAG: porin [Bacteroidetes bacterium]|nr:porin [Bacteroidota bacterium]